MRREYPDELEADFQQYYNLDISETPKARAARLLFQLPRECRVYRKIKPDNNWGWSEMLLNKANYLLELILWSRTEDATKKHPQFKPTPFVPPFSEKSEKKKKEYDARSLDEIKDILTKPRM